jgi:hypothetical protein
VETDPVASGLQFNNINIRTKVFESELHKTKNKYEMSLKIVLMLSRVQQLDHFEKVNFQPPEMGAKF